MDPPFQDEGRASDLVRGKASQKLSCLAGEPAADFSCQDDQACPPMVTCELRIASLFPNSCRSNAAPLTVAHRGRAVPFRERGLTKVVSMANCAPPKSESPSTTTSSLRESRLLMAWRSKSRTNTFVRTRPPASRQIRAEENPFCPGPGCRGDGRTGMNVKSRGGASEGATRAGF